MSCVTTAIYDSKIYLAITSSPIGLGTELLVITGSAYACVFNSYEHGL